MRRAPLLVAATTNRGKLHELTALLAGLGIELRSLADFPPAAAVEESGDTFLANARRKAHAAARHCNAAALADDSGLEVDALGGLPGVRSARFAADAGAGSGDSANLALLLARLEGISPAARTARFRCAVVVARPDGRELIAEGVCAGSIASAPRGSGGFGYDPVFVPLGETRSFAEHGAAEKDRISHRGQAIAALRDRLVTFLA
ncbi:MAG: RdgB/HAM1 family non-canonical purine NTP pyrophosphatase [Deltaproteobacteria bacterium]|nr:RdgB/HAM1 family non-canonical purine NTP pyrophosphatase [Deltaproteobacteria bacterium]